MSSTRPAAFSAWLASLLFAISLMMATGPLASSAQAAGDPAFEAKVYDFDSNKQQLLFTYKRDTEMKGPVRVATSTYKDAAGNVVAVETIEYVKNGDHESVSSYRMQQKQLATEGLVEVKEGKAKFSYTKDGKTKTAEEKIGDDFVVGPSISSYLLSHWDEIKKGDRVKVRLAVPDRLETVGFEFFKDHEEEMNGQKVWALKMKPSSFVIAALVKPLFFVYPTDGDRLLEVRGRTQLKRNVGGSWKDLDAVTTFDYAPAGASAAGNSK